MKRKERGKQGRRLNSLGIQRVGSIVGGKAGFMEKESLKRGINSTKKDSRNRILDLLEVKKLEMRNRRHTRLELERLFGIRWIIFQKMNGRKRPMSLFVILIILRKLLNRVAFIQMDRFIFDCGAKFERNFFQRRESHG